MANDLGTDPPNWAGRVAVLPCRDPRLGEWLLDTANWRNIAAAPTMAERVLRGFGARGHFPHRVVSELGNAAEALLAPNRVFGTEELDGVGELGDWHRLLRERWAREEYGRNEGEAACLAIATARRWRLLLDDHVAVGIAVERGLVVMRTTNLLLAGASCGWWTPDEGWEFFIQMLDAGRNRLGPPLWSWRNKDTFVKRCVELRFDEQP